MKVLREMPVKAPEGYYYEATEHKRNIAAIWLCGGPKYLYRGNTSARTIHSFYNYKKGEWYAPVNSKKVGEVVDPSEIRPWTAMPINLRGLEAFFV